MGEVFKADNYDAIVSDEQKARDEERTAELNEENAGEQTNKVVTASDSQTQPNTTAKAETKG